MNTTIEQKKVSTFEAKTHLSNLLVEVEHGSSIIITKRGKTVAKIIPFQNDESTVDFSEMINSLRKLRTRVKGKVNIKEMKEMGRKR